MVNVFLFYSRCFFSFAFLRCIQIALCDVTLFCRFNKLRSYHLAGAIFIIFYWECIPRIVRSVFGFCKSRLFPLDVSSDLHANDSEHDMQPSSKYKHMSWSWMSETAHDALEFDENHVWTAREKSHKAVGGNRWRVRMKNPDVKIHPNQFHLAKVYHRQANTLTTQEIISVFRDVRIN